MARRLSGTRGLAPAVAAVRRAPELGGLIGLAALLNLWARGQNGWGNTYYSAAVRSMAAIGRRGQRDPRSRRRRLARPRWRVMTVDTPPLSLWVQALSVRHCEPDDRDAAQREKSGGVVVARHRHGDRRSAA